jgi:hypothetical protein
LRILLFRNETPPTDGLRNCAHDWKYYWGQKATAAGLAQAGAPGLAPS